MQHALTDIWNKSGLQVEWLEEAPEKGWDWNIQAYFEDKRGYILETKTAEQLAAEVLALANRSVHPANKLTAHLHLLPSECYTKLADDGCLEDDPIQMLYYNLS
jgi:hypothetical protein